MTHQLPWGWLNAAATSEQMIDDTVIAVKINAMEAHWDDVVPCLGTAKTQCERPAYWVYHCGCGLPVLHCTPHKVWMDTYLIKHPGQVCRFCGADVPEPIPWLPL